MNDTEPTDPFAATQLDLDALDQAWQSYHHGYSGFSRAAASMTEHGVTWPEACTLLDARQPPSQGYLGCTPEERGKR